MLSVVSYGPVYPYGVPKATSLQLEKALGRKLTNAALYERVPSPDVNGRCNVSGLPCEEEDGSPHECPPGFRVKQ